MYIIKLNERVRRIFNLLISYSFIKMPDFSQFVCLDILTNSIFYLYYFIIEYKY